MRPTCSHTFRAITCFRRTWQRRFRRFTDVNLFRWIAWDPELKLDVVDVFGGRDAAAQLGYLCERRYKFYLDVYASEHWRFGKDGGVNGFFRDLDPDDKFETFLSEHKHKGVRWFCIVPRGRTCPAESPAEQLDAGFGRVRSVKVRAARRTRAARARRTR